MEDCLYRVSLAFDWTYKGDRSPVYVVAQNKEDARVYVERHLKAGAKVKSVSVLGERLGMHMYHGKPKTTK